jgi:hypothetical protein
MNCFHKGGNNLSPPLQGGAVAGKARLDLETKTGEKIVSPKNYLPEVKKKKQLNSGK